MLYLAIELSLFVSGAFVLGWWFGRKSRTAVDESTSKVASVEVELMNDETHEGKQSRQPEAQVRTMPGRDG